MCLKLKKLTTPAKNIEEAKRFRDINPKNSINVKKVGGYMPGSLIIYHHGNDGQMLTSKDCAYLGVADVVAAKDIHQVEISDFSDFQEVFSEVTAFHEKVRLDKFDEAALHRDRIATIIATALEEAPANVSRAAVEPSLAEVAEISPENPFAAEEAA